MNDNTTAAREAILQELRRRWKEDRGADVTAPSDISRFHQPQTNRGSFHLYASPPYQNTSHTIKTPYNSILSEQLAFQSHISP